MSNPPDDPGHRPPLPRPAEPQPYPGGYGPPQPPPPPAPWQAQGGYPSPPPAPPGHPARTGRGFFGALFDLSFDEMITVRLARTIYTLMLALITLFALVVLWYGLSFFAWNSTLAVMTIIAAPILWISNAVLFRVFMEFVINQFKITEHLKAMREREELR